MGNFDYGRVPAAAVSSGPVLSWLHYIFGATCGLALAFDRFFDMKIALYSHFLKVLCSRSDLLCYGGGAWLSCGYL
ncbi:hypothetical protein U1Q18_032691 [Sarracenia purpurea var. burkii]